MKNEQDTAATRPPMSYRRVEPQKCPRCDGVPVLMIVQSAPAAGDPHDTWFYECASRYGCGLRDPTAQIAGHETRTDAALAWNHAVGSASSFPDPLAKAAVIAYLNSTGREAEAARLADAATN